MKASFPTAEQEDYQSIDSDLAAWEAENGVAFERWSKGYATRTIWLAGKIQLWIYSPDLEGYVEIHAAELKEDLSSKWGRKVNLRIPSFEICAALDKVWNECRSWL